GLRLAPVYDLVSVCVYPDIEHELAMAIGDEFDFTKIRAFDWADMAERCGIDRRLLVREMNRMVKALRTQLPKLLAQPDYATDEQRTLQDISDLILKQARQLEADAKMITKIDVN
ncbi:MAG: hypothetical protein ABW109_22030, partial [Candidatus Thiodiazotropha sp. 6PLUC4]